MSEMNNWAARVDQATGATVHEQLRTVVRDTEDLLQKFTTSAYEQGGLLLDAQREMETAVERKIAELASKMKETFDAMRNDIAKLQGAPTGAVDLEPLRTEVFSGLAAFGEELDVETKKIREEIAARMDGMAARFSAMEETQKRIETQLDRVAGMEERAAARMVDLLATAFAQLRSAPPSSGPTAIAS